MSSCDRRLAIVVIIAAAVISIVTLGAGASLFAVILVGALVGAVLLLMLYRASLGRRVA